MGIRIKREPFLKIEKAYRILTAVTFYVTLAVILSAVVVVPIFGSSDANWVMVLYSGFYYLYCLGLCGCAVLGAIACYVTKSEVLGLQCALHIIDFILAFLNYKLFTALFLYGIKMDAAAEKLIGADTDAFVKASTEKWIYLVISVLISCILAVLSTVKLSKEKQT